MMCGYVWLHAHQFSCDMNIVKHISSKLMANKTHQASASVRYLSPHA